MKILVACEESQAVTIELRKLGHEAYSCDILPCSGGHPEWHIQDDVLNNLNDGWDALIGFPPCTFMSKAGARWMFPKAGELCALRYEKAMEAKDFFLKLWYSKIPKISLENPLPLKVVQLPEPTQFIQPYQFGHNFSKRTYLWLKGFEPLKPTELISDFTPYIASNTGGAKRGQKATFRSGNAKHRSKTFPGIAKAMARQWAGNILI